MNTARIVVLTIAPGADGIAAYLASQSENKQVLPELAAHLPTTDVLVAKPQISLGWPVIAAANAVKTISRDQAFKRGKSVNAVRHGTFIPTPAQK